MQEKANFFYVAFALCLVGWAYLGWGFLLFPLSLFLALYSRVANLAFWALVFADIAGFSTSIYALSMKFFGVVV